MHAALYRFTFFQAVSVAQEMAVAVVKSATSFFLQVDKLGVFAFLEAVFPHLNLL